MARRLPVLRCNPCPLGLLARGAEVVLNMGMVEIQRQAKAG